MLVQWPVEQIGDECRVVTCGPNRMTPSNHYCPSYYWYKESSLLVCLFWWYIWRSMRLQTQWASFGLFFEAGLPYNPPFHKLHFKITQISEFYHDAVPKGTKSLGFEQMRNVECHLLCQFSVYCVSASDSALWYWIWTLSTFLLC